MAVLISALAPVLPCLTVYPDERCSKVSHFTVKANLQREEDSHHCLKFRDVVSIRENEEASVMVTANILKSMGKPVIASHFYLVLVDPNSFE